MKSVQEQHNSELAEQNLAVSTGEIFTIAKIMLSAVVILEGLMMLLLGSFIGPFYRTSLRHMVAVLVGVIAVDYFFAF